MNGLHNVEVSAPSFHARRSQRSVWFLPRCGSAAFGDTQIGFVTTTITITTFYINVTIVADVGCGAGRLASASPEGAVAIGRLAQP